MTDLHIYFFTAGTLASSYANRETKLQDISIMRRYFTL